MPTMLYRPGETVNPAAWNEKIDTCIVDEGDLEAVLADGWYRHPSDFPTPAAEIPLTALDESAAKIIAALPEMTPEELQALLDGELVGKNRAGLVKALEKALQPPA